MSCNIFRRCRFLVPSFPCGVFRSPIYAHFGETLGGLSAIRAFGHVKLFARTNERLVDNNLACYFALKVKVRGSLLVRRLLMGASIFFQPHVCYSRPAHGCLRFTIWLRYVYFPNRSHTRGYRLPASNLLLSRVFKRHMSPTAVLRCWHASDNVRYLESPLPQTASARRLDYCIVVLGGLFEAFHAHDSCHLLLPRYHVEVLCAESTVYRRASAQHMYGCPSFQPRPGLASSPADIPTEPRHKCHTCFVQCPSFFFVKGPTCFMLSVLTCFCNCTTRAGG